MRLVSPESPFLVAMLIFCSLRNRDHHLNFHLDPGIDAENGTVRIKVQIKMGITLKSKRRSQPQAG